MSLPENPRWFVRCVLISLLVAGLTDLPVSQAFAASDKALGVVIQSEIGRLGSANLTIGTSVYPGDALWTDVGGALRLKVGSGQIYLLASSALTMGREGDAVQGTLTRGTAGFSNTANDKLELVIPEGILRAANGQPAYGQVTITSPTEVVISAYRGALVLDNAGDLHVIGAGSSYHVTMLPDEDAQKQEGSDTQEYPEVRHSKKRGKLVFALVMMGIAGVASFVTYQELTESPSKFDH